jgi:hypothetical protein
MSLLLTFIVIALCGEAFAVGLSFLIEDYVDERAGVPCFFGISALIIWQGWKLALRITEPAAEKQVSRG